MIEGDRVSFRRENATELQLGDVAAEPVNDNGTLYGIN